jgi:hypothetical protein
MFSPENIQERLRVKPFRPLRITVSEGLHYDIFHPDLVLVGLNDLTIGFAAPNKPTIYDRQIRVALIHMVALEDISSAPVPPNSAGNGPAA